MRPFSANQPVTRALENINQVIHAPARLLILTHLYVLESADYVFLMRATGLTWGNLSTHLSKLEDAGYIQIEKTFKGKRPQTTLSLTPEGRQAFKHYKNTLKQVLNDLPD
jgi:DNA-binding MarR family transcriptional regulator